MVIVSNIFIQARLLFFVVAMIEAVFAVVCVGKCAASIAGVVRCRVYGTIRALYHPLPYDA